jgi:serine/threonine-protein kinase
MSQQNQRYKVLEKIASGGMAEVFRAESAGLEGFKKTVAIKRVLPHLSEKKQFIGMFLDEARLSAQLSHSNCVQVFDVGVGDNTYFIVMEYVDGADLKGVIEHQKKTGKPFPAEEAVLMCVRMCEGLSYAHEVRDSRGESLHIVHRDMSPPNVLITRHGEVKIVDFGLAKANSQLEKSEPGIIKGKFSYLSPEAAIGQGVDARTDIFAVGIILWELLAGRRLFIGDTDLETVRQVQRAQVPPIRQFHPNVSPALEAVLAKSLARDPRDRYQTARQFGEDLNEILFDFGRAVSSFDIAKLVEPVRAERDAKARKKALDRGSIIGSLIDEVLFEFRSLDAEGKEGSDDGTGQGSSPLNVDAFERVDDWTKELGELAPSRQQPQSAQPGSGGFETFNLAALEEDTMSGRNRPQSQAAAAQAKAEHRAPQQSLHQMKVPEHKPFEKKAGSKGLLLTIVVLLGAAAAGAGAWFGGLLH